jgi:CheY-like chemotaxis protein
MEDTPLILIVEYEDELRAQIANHLSEAGYHSIGFGDGQDALDYLQTGEGAPNLIISAGRMTVTRLGGYALFEVLRADSRWAGIPYIFLTATGREGHLASRTNPAWEAELYLTKPLDPAALMDGVHHLLNQ